LGRDFSLPAKLSQTALGRGANLQSLDLSKNFLYFPVDLITPGFFRRMLMLHD
jgi:hypothetical protein